MLVLLATSVLAATGDPGDLVLPPGEISPTDHDLVYYNARMALREGHPLEAVKLWLLRNALEYQTGRTSRYDADFRSVTWAALGEAGICPDGYPTDEAGAGIWPIAMHNWVVRNTGRKAKKKRPRYFDAFAIGEQQRPFSLGEVLSSQELRAASLVRNGRCSRAIFMLLALGEPVNVKLSDRYTAAKLMYHLLQQARATLSSGNVRGQAAIEARLFDLDLQLTAMAARRAKQQARSKMRAGREIGMSREGLASVAANAEDYDFSDFSEPAQILEASAQWSAAEWMSLSAERRRFFFDHARAFASRPDSERSEGAAVIDPALFDYIALGVIDELIDEQKGAEIEEWIGRLPGTDERIWGGIRGQRLLSLGPEAGFRERSTIALHRGVHALESGDLQAALRSFAAALAEAPTSRQSETVQSLSRRWLSYATSQFAITDELLATLQEILQRRDYAIVLEDLMWSAALRADRASFERGVRNQSGKDALERRLALLQPLAAGDITKFTAKIRDGLAASPSETLRLLDQMMQRLELEDADVRTAQVPTLAALRRLLTPLAAEGEGSGRARAATEILQRSQAILEGVSDLGPGATARDHARSISPDSEIFAGSVRLAPTDPLPWPFRPTPAAPPSIFEPMKLLPEEWPREEGGWVLGWSVGG